MANQDTNSKLNYWTEGNSGTLIKAKSQTAPGVQAYWYNGSADGYLAGSSTSVKARSFAVLIGF
jgi:hypothetical protein